MALTPSTVIRTDDITGDNFLTFTTAGGARAQGMVVVDENGAQTGISTNAFVVSIDGTVTVTPKVVVRFDSGGTAVASAVITNAAADLLELRILLDPSVLSTRYLMLFDATSLPVNGTAPVWRGIVPPAGELGESWPDGLPFSSGIVAAISSTIDTLTVTGAEAYIEATRA